MSILTARDQYVVYSLYNDLPHTCEGPVLRLARQPGTKYCEAWHDVALEPRIDGGVAQISLSIPPKDMRCVAVEMERKSIRSR